MKIGIVGFGRFGQLLPKYLSAKGEVLVYTKPPCRRDFPGVRFIPLEEVAGADWVILAVPISAIPEVVKEIKDYVQPGAVVLDVCSVKVFPCEAMIKCLPDFVEVIGTHPLFGPDSVEGDIRGKKIVLTPMSGWTNKYQQLKRFLTEELGLFAIETTPEDHDRNLARSQALVHFIGRGLAGLKLKPQHISTPDFESLLKMNTMVENDTWELFFDMQKHNPFAAEYRDIFVKSINELKNKIEAYEPRRRKIERVKAENRRG